MLYYLNIKNIFNECLISETLSIYFFLWILY